MEIKIGTRGSKLALWQANWVKEKIEDKHKNVTAKIIVIKTKGDQILDQSLSKIGGKGLFVKEIEKELILNNIDLAVHSMKDLPMELPDGLGILAVPKRENPHDAIISNFSGSIFDISSNITVGTSSLRRAIQIKSVKKNITIKNLRGNIDTRIKKLKNKEYDAIVVAAAGLIRLGLENEISEYLTDETMLPAAGQGALCIEAKTDNTKAKDFAAFLDDNKTRLEVSAERAFLKELGGSCHIPIAAYAIKKDKTLNLQAFFSDNEGQKIIKKQIEHHFKNETEEEAQSSGILLAKQFMPLT